MGSNLSQGDILKNLKDQMLSTHFGKFLLIYQILDWDCFRSQPVINLALSSQEIVKVLENQGLTLFEIQCNFFKFFLLKIFLNASTHPLCKEKVIKIKLPISSVYRKWRDKQQQQQKKNSTKNYNTILGFSFHGDPYTICIWKYFNMMKSAMCEIFPIVHWFSGNWRQYKVDYLSHGEYGERVNA